MRHLKYVHVFGFTLALTVLTAGLLPAQQAVIEVEAWSPLEIQEMGWTSHPSNGLSVVGVGETVYLFARETAGEAITAVAWTLSTRPGGSVAALDSSNTQRTTFHPDLEGRYVVDVTITSTSGNADTSVTITAGKYVGVGIVGGANPDFLKGQCAACHFGTASAWMGTGHATMFEESIDGLKAAGYNEACLKCHTVGFFEGADNDGFADVAAELGWTFPATLQPGNWQDIVDNFPALAAVSNIQCENCHGPGSLHKGDVTGIQISLAEGLCGRCHEAESQSAEDPYHLKNRQWKNSGHGFGGTWASQGLREIEPTDDFRTECANCHSPAGFIERVDPASQLLDKVGLTGEPLTCAGCHDPHDATNEHQLRLPVDVQLASGPILDFGGTGRLCMRCHQDRRVGGGEAYAANPTSTFRGPHHSNQTDMLAGATEAIITFGMVLPNSTHKDAVENACVGCHMADNERDDLGNHSWAMSATETVNGVTTTYDNVEPCIACHGPLESFEDLKARADHDGDGTIEAAQAEVQGLLDEVAKLLPPYGEPTVDIRDPLWNMEESLLQRKAAWNYAFVDYDHSHGVHNYQFAVALLQNTKAALMYGVLSEGVITGVEDVPNDQGKQVRVRWTRFGGDGVSDNPVREYAIWRMVEDGVMGTAAKALTTLNLSSVDISELTPGTKLSLEDGLWDFVGSVPAATLDEYSTVVPTLYDSTAADGVRMSTFRVSGHTNITAIYAVTEPSSGYSIDNLVPSVPTNLAGLETQAGLALTWDDPVDKDFNNFSVYRSTNAGFDPAGMAPLAEVTEATYLDQAVTVGMRYYYKISALDFSGNESGFSDEFSLIVTSVDGDLTAAIPEDYFLGQNYPNPFNPTTNIRFGLKEAGYVKMTVYNALGEEVMQLLDHEMQPGNHLVTLSGAGLSSGVYFYRLQVNEFSSVKKLIVMK